MHDIVEIQDFLARAVELGVTEVQLPPESFDMLIAGMFLSAKPMGGVSLSEKPAIVGESYFIKDGSLMVRRARLKCVGVSIREGCPWELKYEEF